jgi:hypothetical protein
LRERVVENPGLAPGFFFVSGFTHPLNVMRGLDPRIHDASLQMTTLRKAAFEERRHGSPGHRRAIGEQSDAVLRPAMPGDDAEREEDNAEGRLPLSIMTSPSYAGVNPNASASSA